MKRGVVSLNSLFAAIAAVGSTASLAAPDLPGVPSVTAHVMRFDLAGHQIATDAPVTPLPNLPAIRTPDTPALGATLILPSDHFVAWRRDGELMSGRSAYDGGATTCPSQEGGDAGATARLLFDAYPERCGAFVTSPIQFGPD